MRRICRISVLCVLVLAHLCAQSLSDWSAVMGLPAGTKIRVVSGSRTVSGKIERVSAEALVILRGRSEEMFDRAQVASVAVSKREHRGRNTLIGLAAGSGAGLGIGMAARSGPHEWQIIPNSAVVAGFTAAGAIVGTLVGVVIPTGGWREVYRSGNR